MTKHIPALKKGALFVSLTVTLLFLYSLFMNKNAQKQQTTLSPAWMVEQIHEDLAPFQKEGIREETLNDVMQKALYGDGLCRFKILDGKVYAEGPSLQHPAFVKIAPLFIRAFEKLVKTVDLPPVDLIISLKDEEPAIDENIPIFVMAKSRSSKGRILLPDYEALRGYEDPQAFIKKGQSKYPWEKKHSKAFWRGATTGGTFDPSHWKQLARTQLVLLSLNIPHLVDARFTKYCQGAENNPEMRALPDLIAQAVTPLDSLKNKYLIDVDGNTCGYSRFYWTLLSNSLVIKQLTDNIQWYYRALKPYIHFLPVKKDFSDLTEALSWARAHDLECEHIAQNATQFVLENVREEHIYLYLDLLLNKYANLLIFDSHEHHVRQHL